MRKKICAAALTVFMTGCAPPTADVMESLTVSDTAQAYSISETSASAETAEANPAAIILEETAEPEVLPLTPKSYSGDMLSAAYLKPLGRTHNEDGILWLAHSASGAEFTMDGTYCAVTRVGDSMAQTGRRARFAASVDGERVLDEMLSEKEMTFEIFASEEPEVRYTIESIGDASDEVIETKIVTDPKSEKVTVTLIKLSEALHSTVEIGRAHV